MQNQRNQALNHQQNLYNMGANIQAADLARRQGSIAPQVALNEYGATNNNQLNYHNAEVNRIQAQHQMDMNAYKAKPPTLGQKMMGLAPVIIGGMMGGPVGAGMGMAASHAMTSNNQPVGNIGVLRPGGVTDYRPNAL